MKRTDPNRSRFFSSRQTQTIRNSSSLQQSMDPKPEPTATPSFLTTNHLFFLPHLSTLKQNWELGAESKDGKQKLKTEIKWRQKMQTE